MGAIKVFLKEVVLPITLAFCLASFLKPIYMPDGVCDYFLMWICVGLPFGIRRMCASGSFPAVMVSHDVLLTTIDSLVHLQIEKDERVKECLRDYKPALKKTRQRILTFCLRREY